MSVALPTVLGRYTLLRLLGSGGQGQVYDAEQRAPGAVRRVALKVLSARGEDLYREARLGGLLRHPHIVDVFEVGEHAGTWFCAMERCDGSLAGRPPLSSRAIVEVGLQVCDALAYAHQELELVHLDLKPANLLVRDGAVKVGDLGIATARGFERDDTIRGTPRFMAPEQRLGLGVDARADIFALGRVLLELAGGPAADDVTVADDRDGPLDDAAGTDWLRPVVDRCLEPDAVDRFPTMQALAAALRRLPVAGPSLREEVGAGPPDRSSDDPGSNLGSAEDALHGRADLLAALADAFSSPGPVTLKGPPGIGKSRLAREAGRRYRERTGQEAWLLDLVGARTERDLLQRVAHALDVPLRGAAARHVLQVGDALAGRGSPMLILDSFEHAAALREVVNTWVSRAPEARVLVTTRIPLNLKSERILEVAPLHEADAVALLVRQAQKRGVDVAGDPSIPEIARRLDGVPLALELAAGRLGVLSPSEVLDRLGLSLLRSGSLGLPPRQATLRGALDWSWELLPAPARTALAQLSVFRGGFASGDVSGVLDTVAFEQLETLGAHSVLVRRDDRFDLLATVQAYAAERLAESGPAEVLHERHAEWFARTGADVAWRPVDLPNLAVAVARAAAAGWPELAARAAFGAATLLQERGPMDEGIALLSLAQTGCPVALQGELLVRRAALRIDAGQLAEAEEDLSSARAIVGDDLALQTFLAQEEGDLHLARGEVEPAGRAYARALELAERRGASTGRALLCLGAVQLESRDLDHAERTCRRAIDELRRVGDRRSEASALGNLGIVLRRQGRANDARALYLQALALGEQGGARASIASDVANLAILEAEAGHLDRARTHFERAIALFRVCGIRGPEAQQLANLAELELQLGRPDAARRCAESAYAVHRELGNRRLEGHALQVLALVEELEGNRLGARERYDRALTCQLEARAEVPVALTQIALARLDHEDGAADRALDRLGAVLPSLADRPSLRAVALAVRAEIRATLGASEASHEDIAEALLSVERASPQVALVVWCAAARIRNDRSLLARAEALEREGTVHKGSPSGADLERTRQRFV